MVLFKTIQTTQKRTKDHRSIYNGMEKLKLYLADIEDKEDGLLRLSLVKHPATGCACKVLSVGERYVRVFAPIIVTNKPIYRKDKNLGEYNLLFLPDVVNDIQTRTAIRTPRIKFDIEHNGKDVEGVVVVKSFLIDYQTETLYNNYFGLPDGSWVMELLIPHEVVSKVYGNKGKFNTNKVYRKDTKFNLPNMVNRENASRITSDDFFGISISGIFTYNEVSLQEAIEIYNKIKE